MRKNKTKPLSPRGLKTFPLRSRKSKVDVTCFARPFTPQENFTTFFNSFPDILAGRDFRRFILLVKKAKIKNKTILFGLGAHVIKVGLNPIIIDLMEQGWVTALALNGAGIIHDFEIAYAGQTSEDVESQIKGGQFGMARETGKMLNQAINHGAESGFGLGEAIGKMMAEANFPYKESSLLWTAERLNIPVTVHVAIGTDTIHFHPEALGEAIGKTTLEDFFLLCSLLKKLEGGGVFLNIGSAVILPEVFLKALSLVRNKGQTIEDFSTAVFDFIHHYRPDQNVIKRPLTKKGRGFYFIGHHEFMVPLLAASLKA